MVLVCLCNLFHPCVTLIVFFSVLHLDIVTNIRFCEQGGGVETNMTVCD